MTEEGLTITDAAERTGVTAHTLRYYERIGLMPEVNRAGSGHRRYTERDLQWVGAITKLRATGMPVKEIERYVQLVRDGADTERERLDLLAAHRERVLRNLEEVTEQLAAISRKADFHAGLADSCERPDAAVSEPRRDAAADRR